jgi:hypothetical protein
VAGKGAKSGLSRSPNIRALDLDQLVDICITGLDLYRQLANTPPNSHDLWSKSLQGRSRVVSREPSAYVFFSTTDQIQRKQVKDLQPAGRLSAMSTTVRACFSDLLRRSMPASERDRIAMAL